MRASMLMTLTVLVGFEVTSAAAKPTSTSMAFHGSYSGYLDTQSAATFTYKNFIGSAAFLGKSTFTAAAKYGERFGAGSGCFIEEGTGKLTAKNGSSLRFAYSFRGCERTVSSAPIAGFFLVFDGTHKLAGVQGSGTYVVNPSGIITLNGKLTVK